MDPNTAVGHTVRMIGSFAVVAMFIIIVDFTQTYYPEMIPGLDTFPSVPTMFTGIVKQIRTYTGFYSPPSSDPSPNPGMFQWIFNGIGESGIITPYRNKPSTLLQWDLLLRHYIGVKLKTMVIYVAVGFKTMVIFVMVSTSAMVIFVMFAMSSMIIFVMLAISAKTVTVLVAIASRIVFVGIAVVKYNLRVKRVREYPAGEGEAAGEGGMRGGEIGRQIMNET